jgi:hypothetical protein
MKPALASAVAWVALGVTPGGCGDGAIVADGPATTGDACPGGGTPWVDLPHARVSVAGGAAPEGDAGSGGAVRVVSSGGIVLGPAAGGLQAPAVPAPPAGGAVLDARALDADVTRAETISIKGVVEAGGDGATRTITSTTGDVVIEGTLRASASRSIALRAPAGTVFVTGAIVTTAADDGVLDGDDGGAITIDARQVVITGQLHTRGERNAAGDGGGGGAITITATHGSVHGRDAAIDGAGGAGQGGGGGGGALTITADGSISLSGTVDVSGGDARGNQATTGGRGGSLRLAARGDVALGAAVCVRGGAATSVQRRAAGGAAGRVHIDATGWVTIAGGVDARGGPAIAAGGHAAVGGAATEIFIGAGQRPAAVRVLVPVDAGGGDGGARGGDGGVIALEPRGGDLVIAGTVEASGGASRARAGRGGQIRAEIGAVDGGIRIAGDVIARGGSATDSAVDADGGDGGVVHLRVRTPTGDFRVDPTGTVDVDGGASSGAGRAGGAGSIDLLTRDGDMSMAGHLYARGGTAPDPGGTGGDGGPLYIFTDTDADGIGGHLTIEATGVIDVSGGAGTFGGSARNNRRWGVAYFPHDRHLLAVLLNSDNAPEALTDGVLQNLGVIVARGAGTDGWGGDVIFHGRRPDSSRDPEPGDVSVDGHGAGQAGQVAMQ